MIRLYIIGSPLDTARALDPDRLRKQIDDAGILIDNINLKLHTRRRGKYWNDPLVNLYLPHIGWLYSYIEVLDLIKCGGNYFSVIERSNSEAELCKPDFHNQEFFDKQKQILFNEDNEYYSQWSNL
jgi:hypothetical protein